MKYLTLFLILFHSFNSQAVEDEKIVKATLDKVSVYLNGATLNQTATVSVPAGTSTLVFKRVSSKIEQASIRATLSNGVKVLAISYEQDKVTSGFRDSVRLEKINDTLLVVEKEKRRLTSVLRSLEAERLAVDKNSALKSETATVSEIMKLGEYYRTRIAEINKQEFLINENIMDLNTLVGKYANETKRLKSVVKVEVFYQLKLTVHSDGPTTTNINLKYLVGGAAWTPKYDIYTEGVDAGINIDYNASVMNQCGEDWKDVKIILSTADPMSSHNIPALTPWTLNYGKNYSNEGRLNSYGPKKVSSTYAQSQNGTVQILENVEYEEIEMSNVAVDFDIKGKYTIPSDSKPYLLEVNTYKLQAGFQYFSIPKADKDAFLLAQITGWEKLNLIEGPTSIYFRNTFIGHSYIKPQYANDTLDISMGRDNKVMVNRIKVEDRDAQKIIGTNKRETFTYKITVRNTNNNAVKLELLDQIPVSQNSEITVETHNISGAELEPLSGQLKWNVDLKPGESKEFIISFSVKYPKAKSVHVSASDKISQRKVRAKF